MKVFIVKRPTRFDPRSEDPKGIKQQLSKFANHVYDQLWFKRGCVNNIFIVDIDMNCTGPGYLKDLIYGAENVKNYDGVHLRGEGASRHYTYRAVNAIGPVINNGNIASDYHLNCPQARHQRQFFKVSSRFSRVKNTDEKGNKKVQRSIGREDKYQHRYEVPTSNIFEHLN